MLEGQEISEVKLSDLDSYKRIDAELFNKNYVLFKSAIKQMAYTTFADECLVIRKGIFNVDSDCYCKKGVPFVRISNLDSMIIDTKDMVYIPSGIHKDNLKTELKRGDIVLSKTAVAAASIVNIDCCNVSQDIVAIKFKANSKVLSHYVVVFLNTVYGNEQLQRRFTGNVQMHLNLEECKNEVMIPVFPIQFQLKIKTLFEKAILLRSQSQMLYSETQKLLLENLNLTDWQHNNNQVNVKSLKESFLSSGRLDAEYYQVRFDELEAKIKWFHYKTIAEIQQFNARGVQPNYVEKGHVPVVNSKHILEEGLDYDNFERTTEVFLSSQNRAQIGYGDILIYTTGANIGRTQAYLKHDYALASNHVNILRVKGVNPVYLAFVLNSPIGRMQTEKLCSGSAQVEIYPNDIEKIIVPILDETKQETIAAKVQDCFALKMESKRLLNVAKTAVEIAICEGEEKALKYLKENGNE